MYTNPIGITEQFKFCGNPLRIDLYKGCDFKCNYCFSNSRLQPRSIGKTGENDVASIETIRSFFEKAYDSTYKLKKNDIDIELIRNRVPLHCGGMSDPFQPNEFIHKLTLELIKISKEFNHPIIFSTKTSHLTDEYFEVLDPNIHAFQISLLGIDDDYVRKYEKNTPKASERISFIEELKSRGFWVGLRIQPLIDIDQATRLTDFLASRGLIDYITVEHLKIPENNMEYAKLLLDDYNISDYYRPKASQGGRGITQTIANKTANFNTIASIANEYGVKVGCGDNDLHHLSQSRCCCGVDLMGENFSNYLKYNLTYFVTGEVDYDSINEFDTFYRVPFLKAGVNRDTKLSAHTDEYITKNTHLIPNNEYGDALYKHLKLNKIKRLIL